MALLVQELSFSTRGSNHCSPDGDTAVYYAGRASKARTMAQAAINPAIRDIHLAMAREYETKAELSAVRVVRIRPSIRA